MRSSDNVFVLLYWADWNERTEMKMEELKLANERLCKVSVLASSVTEMIRTSAGNQKESIFVDGAKLKVTHSLSKVFLNAPRNIFSPDDK